MGGFIDEQMFSTRHVNKVIDEARSIFVGASADLEPVDMHAMGCAVNTIAQTLITGSNNAESIENPSEIAFTPEGFIAFAAARGIERYRQEVHTKAWLSEDMNG
jgi:hypothetical protein